MPSNPKPTTPCAWKTRINVGWSDGKSPGDCLENKPSDPGVVAHTCYPSARKAEAGGPSKFQTSVIYLVSSRPASQDHIWRLCLKKKKKRSKANVFVCAYIHTWQNTHVHKIKLKTSKKKRFPWGCIFGEKVGLI